MKRVLTFATLGVAGLALAGCPGKSEQKLNGGGSSFVNPLMTQWAGLYLRDKNVKVDYSSTGSANGIQQMIEKKNDFGCTDAPMTDQQMKQAADAGGDIVHIPLVMGGVVPVYNLEQVKETLRFTGPVLADIFLRKIKKWNHPKLKELNPDAELPDQEIAVVHRSDGSGTTYIFTDYLCKVSDDWAKGPGRGTEVEWAADTIGAQKNDGIAGQVSRTPGAIGYVELIYALNKKDIKYGSVQNKAGAFVLASLESVTAAADKALSDIPDDLRYSITDPPGKESYPISGTVWAVLYVKQPTDKAKPLAEFFRWVTHEGQEHAKELHYARLPRGLVERVDKKLEQIGK